MAQPLRNHFDVDRLHYMIEIDAAYRQKQKTLVRNYEYLDDVLPGRREIHTYDIHRKDSGTWNFCMCLDRRNWATYRTNRLFILNTNFDALAEKYPMEDKRQYGFDYAFLRGKIMDIRFFQVSYYVIKSILYPCFLII